MYEDDLAYIHDVGFSEFARRSTPGILRLLADAGIDSGTVVDLGCGNGIWLASLIEAGYEAFGIEKSPAMARRARRRARGASVCVGSLHDLELPPCNAVTAIGEVLGYVAPGARSVPLRHLFERVAATLPAGGLFVFDLIMPARGKPMRYRRWDAGEDWAILVEVEEQPQRRRLARRLTTFRRVGQSYRRRHESHELRLVSRADVEVALRAAGFSVRVMRRYGDFELPPQRLAFRSRKRSSSRRTGSR